MNSTLQCISTHSKPTGAFFLDFWTQLYINILLHLCRLCKLYITYVHFHFSKALQARTNSETRTLEVLLPALPWSTTWKWCRTCLVPKCPWKQTKTSQDKITEQTACKYYISKAWHMRPVSKHCELPSQTVFLDIKCICNTKAVPKGGHQNYAAF